SGGKLARVKAGKLLRAAPRQEQCRQQRHQYRRAVPASSPHFCSLSGSCGVDASPTQLPVHQTRNVAQDTFHWRAKVTVSLMTGLPSRGRSAAFPEPISLNGQDSAGEVSSALSSVSSGESAASVSMSLS